MGRPFFRSPSNVGNSGQLPAGDAFRTTVLPCRFAGMTSIFRREVMSRTGYDPDLFAGGRLPKITA